MGRGGCYLVGAGEAYEMLRATLRQQPQLGEELVRLGARGLRLMPTDCVTWALHCRRAEGWQ